MYDLERYSLIVEYRACVEHYNSLARLAMEKLTLGVAVSLESARRNCELARTAIDAHRSQSAGYRPN